MNLEHSVLIKMELCFCHSERKERSSVAKHLSKKKKKKSFFWFGTSHSAYAATETESDGAKIDGLL